MPKTLLVVKQTEVAKAKFPAIDFHFHGGELETDEDYRRMIATMDEVGVGMICNMDGGSGERFDRRLAVMEPFQDRFVLFARVNWEGISEPGWAERAAAELERCFRAGAQGLKISKALGLGLRNPDGSYVQADDERLDAIWETCASNNKPVMMHLSDPVARFHPIGPENERYEAGMWRDTPEGNYYGAGIPHYDEIFEHRERMLEKHPKTTFVMAHVASMGWDLARVTQLLDKHPNTHVEISARLQELGRQPYTSRRFLLQYQDRVLFGTDGDLDRDADGFWRPHWRFLETDDEYFDHPAQMLSPLGAPLQGRWKIYGVFLPDEVLRKIYYENALRFLPAARAAMKKHLAARNQLPSAR
jgi:predicted TIM-barrel fold metal-dependent hydrolase